MIPKEFLKGKKVLVMGLGTLGGGVATSKWLLRHGAKVTITDTKKKLELAEPIKSLGKDVEEIHFVLGRHKDSDFKSHDIIVVNPAVSRKNPYLKIAKRAGAKIENEASLFFRFCKNPVIGITGTRGKTTVAIWTHYFLKKKFPRAVLTGNSSKNALLSILDRLDGKSPVVAELSSFQLEFITKAKKSPHISVITNLMPDHLNRHGTMTSYAQEKANIFKYQDKKDILLLAKDNKWTPFFLKQKPKSKIVFYDTSHLGFSVLPSFISRWGKHNLDNLRAAAFAAYKAGVSWKVIKKSLGHLPLVRFRQEVIFKSKALTVINDTTSTTPEAAIAALERFKQKNSPIILIGGGTDKGLDFSIWARAVRQHIKPEHLILIEGSATAKMIAALPRPFKAHIKTYRTLKSCFRAALGKARGQNRVIILFSPAATSFEGFKNEFDRGEQFNQVVTQLLSP